MFIDDDGTNIRWYLSQTQTSTFIGSPGKGWAVTVNGQNIGGNFTWPAGGGTRLIAGPATATYSQTVAFAIGATGTSGFGNGGTIYGTVTRATVPDPPSTPVASAITPTSMKLTWLIPNNGGSAIDGMLLRRSSTSSFASYVDYSLSAGATSHTVTGLDPATVYYWRVFAHNGRGFSSPSGTTSAQTGSGAYASINGTWVPVPINVSDGTVWTSLAPLISDGTNWEVAI